MSNLCNSVSRSECLSEHEVGGGNSLGSNDALSKFACQGSLYDIRAFHYRTHLLSTTQLLQPKEHFMVLRDLNSHTSACV